MNPSGIWKEYAATIGKTAGSLSDAEKMMSMFWKAQQVAASDPGAWQRFMDSSIGKQALFNTKLFEAQVAFGLALQPIRLFAYEVGTVAIGALMGFGTAMKIGVTESIKMTFTVALPSLVKIGVGNVILLLGQMVSAVSDLLGKLGIGLGAGLAGKLTSFGANLVGTGQMGAAEYGAWREKSVNAIKNAFTGGGEGVDMSPVVFPDMPAKPGADPTESQQKKELARLLRMIGGGGFADAPNKLGPAGTGKFGGQRGRIGIGDFADGKGVPQGETPFDQFEQRVQQAAQRTNREFGQLGTNMAMTLGNAFAAGLGAVMQGKNPFKAFGNVVLAGLGGIMTSMGQALIEQGAIMLTLLPFLSNPLTSGPAMIAAGSLLVALGSTLGGIATGSGKGGGGGKGGSGGFGDKTTHITLTADGLGGRAAPATMANQMPTLLVDSPRGQRVLATSARGAARRNIK
jgi:hypothetical protein